MSRICLNAIVKNESARIERMLASVAPHISCWVICDTGSEDGTQAVIRDFFGARGMPGRIVEFPFTNFAESRNQALDAALQYALTPPFEYLLLCDADMELVAPDGLGELTAPGYMMLQRAGNMAYWNARLLRRDNHARYVTPTHEYLSTPLPLENLHHAWFLDHADGANRPGKIARDIKMLEAEIARNPNDARSWFYLGQSKREIGDYHGAIHDYLVRASLGGWAEEIFYAKLQISRCLRDIGQ